MTEEEILGNIVLNENAYFLKNISSVHISYKKISDVFKAASIEKSSNYLLNIINRKITIATEEIKYSFCVFKYETKPTFIDVEIEKWIETKLAYLLIAEIGDYLVISKKNISNIQEFLKFFIPIDYKTLSTLFVDDNTLFEKFGLKNMNVSDKAVRQKSIEATDLKENFSSLGAGNYVLNSLRVNNLSEKVSIMLNSSRINKFGKKNDIKTFLMWSKNQIEKIKRHVNHDTFLTIFAEPQDYETIKDSLVPIGILFIFSNLYEDFENHLIDKIIIRTENNERVLDVFKQLDKFNKLCRIDTVSNSSGNVYKVSNSIASDLCLKLNDKSITLKSDKLKNVILVRSDSTEISFIDYVNQTNQFIVNFENFDLIYTNRKLFKDNKLLGNIDHFLKIFIPRPELDVTISEKGNFSVGQTKFDLNSIFGFVENTFVNNCDYFICDDLGKEWADHIGITDDKIMFFHSKHKDSGYSASSFQDIVGQAQKNLGNLCPQDFQLESKDGFWSALYTNDNVTTGINRLRKGNSVVGAINQFKQTTKNPNLKREVYLVIDFVSKTGLKTKLDELIANMNFREKNEVIQILWFISSLVSSCQEIGVDVYIYCKP